eukprot:6546735-Pyramimonas_sp.AAC.1
MPRDYSHWAALRRELLKKRIEMRASRMQATALPAVEEELRDVSQRMRLLRQRHMRAERVSFVQASSEAWARRNISEAMGWARGAARCRFSSKKKRDVRRFGATPISRQEWLDVWQLPGGEGGMK